MKILVLYHSLYGHIHSLAEAVAEGVKEVPGAEVVLRRVPETMPEDILKKIGAMDMQEKMAHVPVCSHDDLKDVDGIIFGTPTRFGNMSGQMRQFLDTTGGIWAGGGWIGKPGSVFTSSGTPHGGQESTLLSFHITLLHHGMVIVGVPFSHKGLSVTSEVTGGTPYGASTIAGGQNERMPTENELDVARFQGKHVAEIAAKLKT